LLKNHPQIDAVVEIDSILACKPIIESGVFDRVVDLHLQLKYCDVYKFEYTKSCGRRDITTRNYYHQGSLLEMMSYGAGLERIDGWPRLFLSAESVSKVNRLNLPSHFVVFHARSNVAKRNWTDEKWNELAHVLVERFRFTVVEIGLESVLKPRNGMINLCGQLSFVETAEVIRRANVFLGIDSGPAHVANAFKIPSVILVGCFDNFHRYMPYTGFLKENAHDMVIQWDGPASEIPLSEVLRRFELAVYTISPHGIAPNSTVAIDQPNVKK